MIEDIKKELDELREKYSEEIFFKILKFFDHKQFESIFIENWEDLSVIMWFDLKSSIPDEDCVYVLTKLERLKLYYGRVTIGKN